jgi:hypothetical protein
MIKLAINSCVFLLPAMAVGGGGLREARLHTLNLARALHTLLFNVGVCGLSCLYRIEKRERAARRTNATIHVFLLYCFCVLGRVWKVLDSSRRDARKCLAENEFSKTIFVHLATLRVKVAEYRKEEEEEEPYFPNFHKTFCDISQSFFGNTFL